MSQTPIEMATDGDLGFLRSRSKPPRPTGHDVRIADLFSGAGGMTLGAFEAARSLGLAAEVVLAMELREATRSVYDANFSSSVSSNRNDVRCRFDGDLGASLTVAEKRTVQELGKIDLLLGGPPCQGHSSLNNHTRNRDPQNGLYLRMIRAVEVIQPVAVVVENVPNVRLDADDVVSSSTRHLETLGYAPTELVLAAHTLGVPQLRIRHLLVATRIGTPPVTRDDLAVYTTTEPRDLRWAIGDLVDRPPAGILDSASVLSDENRRRAEYLLRHDKFDLPNQRRPPCHRDKPDHRYKSMYGRLAWEQPAQTITTGFGSPGQGRYLHPSLPRTITPHEAARIQFFPDWFDFSPAPNRTVLAECIGNAVPPKVAFCVARAVLSAVRSMNLPASRLAG